VLFIPLAALLSVAKKMFCLPGLIGAVIRLLLLTAVLVWFTLRKAHNSL